MTLWQFVFVFTWIHRLLHIIWEWNIESWGLTHASAPWQLWALQMLLLSVRTGTCFVLSHTFAENISSLYFCRGSLFQRYGSIFMHFPGQFLTWIRVLIFVNHLPTKWKGEQLAQCGCRCTGQGWPLGLPCLRILGSGSCLQPWVEFESTINLKGELMDGPSGWVHEAFDYLWWCLAFFYRIVWKDADVDVLDCSWFFQYLAGHADREASPDCSILLSQRFPATNGGPNSKERTATRFVVIYPPLRVELHCSILACEPNWWMTWKLWCCSPNMPNISPQIFIYHNIYIVIYYKNKYYIVYNIYIYNIYISMWHVYLFAFWAEPGSSSHMVLQYLPFMEDIRASDGWHNRS